MATIKDIARKAGVSVTTVSRALNDHFDVSAETKKQINKVAKELKYVPNRAAQNLVTRKSKYFAAIFFGLLKEVADDGIANLLITGMLEYAKKIDYEVVIYTIDAAYQKEKSYVQFCNEHQVGGAVLYGIRLDDSYFKEIVNRDFPTVLVDVQHGGKNTSTITIDNVMAAKEATELLIKNNHRNIGMIAGREEADVSILRIEGYKSALKGAGIQINEEYIGCGNFLEKDAYEETLKLVSDHRELTAIFCASDLMAIGCINAIKKLGLTVPDDISVMGFDDIRLAKYLTPSLSTVKQDFFMMGYYAAQQLYRMINKEKVKKNIYLEYKVLARNSINRLE